MTHTCPECGEVCCCDNDARDGDAGLFGGCGHCSPDEESEDEADDPEEGSYDATHVPAW